MKEVITICTTCSLS